jgi:hypothetical protein
MKGMRLAALVVATGCLVVFGQSSSDLLQLQGRLSNADGSPVNGSCVFVVSLYATASGGTPVYTQTLSGVEVSAGFYTLSVGAPGALAPVFAANPDLYVGLEVNGTGEMAPRIRLASAGFAFNAQRVGGLAASDLAVASHGHADIAGVFVRGDFLGLGRRRGGAVRDERRLRVEFPQRPDVHDAGVLRDRDGDAFGVRVDPADIRGVFHPRAGRYHRLYFHDQQQLRVLRRAVVFGMDRGRFEPIRPAADAHRGAVVRELRDERRGGVLRAVRRLAGRRKGARRRAPFAVRDGPSTGAVRYLPPCGGTGVFFHVPFSSSHW